VWLEGLRKSKKIHLTRTRTRRIPACSILPQPTTLLHAPLISEEKSKTVAVVLSLVKPLLGKGHTLWINNFYNAPALATKLKFMKTDYAGTLHLNRKHIPKTVKEKRLRKGEIIAQHSGPVSVLKWCDKKICQHDLSILW
jgi:hypothetical protein